MAKELTRRQQIFVAEYLVDRNATRSDRGRIQRVLGERSGRALSTHGSFSLVPRALE